MTTLDVLVDEDIDHDFRAVLLDDINDKWPKFVLPGHHVHVEHEAGVTLGLTVPPMLLAIADEVIE